jgi:peptide/nickel transport system substrate-binding protein
MIAEEAGSTGLAEINVIKSPEAEYWDEVWLKQPFMISAHVHRHPAAAIPMSFDCDSQYPETHWCYPEFDELLHAALAEPDEAKRMEMYHELEEWITEEGGDIFEGHVYTVAAIRSNCSGYVPHSQISRFDSRELYCEP